VVGQFKRGKSTLMNAVLGRDLLPTGLLPLTSAITTLCYGSTERVVLRRKGWALEQEVPLAMLSDFITERGNPGNEKGLAPFEQALTTFLAESQGRTFLVSVLDRALRLMAETFPALDAAPVDGELEPPMGVLELRRTMESVRAGLLAGAPLSAAIHAAEPTAADPHVIDQAIAAGRSSARRAGGGQAKARTGTCPICEALGEALFAFFAKWQYTLATDATAQRAFAAERGLCPVHTWQYQEMASPQGISDGYASLIETLAVELFRLIERTAEHVAAPLATLLASTTTCAACRLVRETAAEQVKQLLAHLATAEGRNDYASSAGVCLPHLQAALTRLEDSDDGTIEGSIVAEFLLHEQVRRLENLTDDLHSYALKRDALRRGLLHQEEANAWRRALVQVVGERAARGGALMADQETV
jgi:hypothetical protein